jgi:hypothetical protein
MEVGPLELGSLSAERQDRLGWLFKWWEVGRAGISTWWEAGQARLGVYLVGVKAGWVRCLPDGRGGGPTWREARQDVLRCLPGGRQGKLG